MHTHMQMQVIQKFIYHAHKTAQLNHYSEMNDSGYLPTVAEFFFSPRFLLSWYREHTLTTLLHTHLKFIKHVTLPEFPPYLSTDSF